MQQPVSPYSSGNTELVRTHKRSTSAYSQFSPTQGQPPVSPYVWPRARELDNQLAARLYQNQQRSQLEHMSEVLYGNPSLPNIASPPPSGFAANYPAASYLQAVRRVASNPQNSWAANASLPPQATAAFHENGRPTSQVYGFAPNGSYNQSSNERLPSNAANPSTTLNHSPYALSKPTTWDWASPHISYFEWDDWVHNTRGCTLWNEPIHSDNSPAFLFFLGQLTNDEMLGFTSLFHGNPWGQAGDLLSARLKRQWFSKLAPSKKTAFNTVIKERRRQIEEGSPANPVAISPSPLPTMMLWEALEAIETRYSSHKVNQLNQNFHLEAPLSKASSTPNLKGRQGLEVLSIAADMHRGLDPFTTYFLLCVSKIISYLVSVSFIFHW